MSRGNFRASFLEKISSADGGESLSIEAARKVLEEQILNDLADVDLTKLAQFAIKHQVPSSRRVAVWKLLLGITSCYPEARKVVAGHRTEEAECLLKSLKVMRKTNADPPEIIPTDRDIVSMVHLADPSVPLAGLRQTRPVSVSDKALVSIARHMTKLALSTGPTGWIDAYWLTLCFNKLLSKIFDDDPKLLREYVAEVRKHITKLEEKIQESIREQEEELERLTRQHSRSPERESMESDEEEIKEEEPTPKVTCFEGVDDDRICLWFRSAGGFWLCDEPLFRLWDKICTGEAVWLLLKTVLIDLLTAVAQQWFTFKDAPQVPPDFIMKNYLTKDMEIKIITRSFENIAKSGKFAARRK